MLCSISSTGKSSSKWLDRLRSSKGFPSAEVDLEQFLNHNQSSNPPNLERESPTSTSDPKRSRNDRTFEAQNPDGETRLLNMMSNVLAELFVMGNSNSLPSVHGKKCSRKQPNPKFCAPLDSPGSNTINNNNSASNENALRKNESASPMSDHNSGVGMAKDRSSDEQLKLVDDVNCGDEEEKEKGCVNLLGFTRTEVTVIDTSFATWKFEKMLFRKKNVWKVRDKKGKMVNLGKKKKRKACGMDNVNNGGAEAKKQKIVHGQCCLSKKGGRGAINEESHQSNKSSTFGKAYKKNSDKGSSVVLIRNIPTSKKIGASCSKSTQRLPKA